VRFDDPSIKSELTVKNLKKKRKIITLIDCNKGETPAFLYTGFVIDKTNVEKTEILTFTFLECDGPSTSISSRI